MPSSAAAPMSILDSPLWQNAGANQPPIPPTFAKGFDAFLTWDRYGGPWLVKQGLTRENWWFAYGGLTELPVASPSAKTTAALPDGGKNGEEKDAPLPFPFMAAVPFTVPREWCNEGMDCDEDGEEGLAMSSAAVSLFTDMLTSFHTQAALYPATSAHVSVSIQTNVCGRLRLGGEYIAIARIDKMGRRIVYASVSFVARNIPAGSAGAETVAAEGLLSEGATIPQLIKAVSHCVEVANSKHVIAILSSEATKKAAETVKA